MSNTIGNPLSWGAQAVAGTGRAAAEVADTLGSHSHQVPRIRRIGIEDIRHALRAGMEDLGHFRSDVLVLVVIYPVIGLALSYMAFNQGLLHLVFPMLSGFALLGPVAAVGLYELSRRRETGDDPGWSAIGGVLQPGVVGPVVMLGLFLLGLFTVWLFAAYLIYSQTIGPVPTDSAAAFFSQVFTTPAGWEMIIIGCAVGFVFALTALVISMISFPMLIDRRVGLPLAVVTSAKLAARNPVTVATWGLIVAVSLAVASIPMLLGLVLVLPLLGHATWHLYRAAVVWEDGQ